MRFIVAVVTSVVVSLAAAGSAPAAPPCTISGTAGDDVLLGTSGPDVICGLKGRDRIEGLGGDDVLVGGPGGDTLIGGPGNDQLLGEVGPDVLTGDEGADVFDGGDGADRADYSARTAPLIISIDAAANDGTSGEGDNVTTSVEQVHTGSGNDVVVGSPGDDTIRAFAGSDRISGGGGSDRIFAGGGHDVVVGGLPGIDELDALTCGGGADTYSPDAVDVLTGCESQAGAASIAAGDAHTCAVRTTGTVACWGRNGAGQLGDGTTTSRSTPVTVQGITDATAVAAGSEFSCAVRAGGTIACWGANVWGQLGNGTATGSSTPVTVQGITDAIDLTAGWGHACATRDNLVRTVVCWGSNMRGQLGDGTTTDRSTPVTVTASFRASSISAGMFHTCGVSRTYDVVACWGSNSYGQLGDGTMSDRREPTLIQGHNYGQDVQDLAVSAGQDHTCAVRSTGAVACWGFNAYGQVGAPLTSMSKFAPFTVPGIAGATGVAGGTGHSCAALADGTVRCWGLSGEGRLGDGTAGGVTTTPVTALGVTGATAITASGHTCALAAGTTAVCWGKNEDGQLGDGAGAGGWRPLAFPVLGP